MKKAEFTTSKKMVTLLRISLSIQVPTCSETSTKIFTLIITTYLFLLLVLWAKRLLSVTEKIIIKLHNLINFIASFY